MNECCILELNPDHFAFSFILEMIDRNPLKRISAKEVKNSLSRPNNNYTTVRKISSNLIKGKICLHSKIMN